MRDPERVRRRLLQKVVRSASGCWEWAGCRFPNGYAQIKVDGRTCHAHRISYELFVGPIPEGLTIDHLCRNKGCVNPAHLEAVTGRENTFRARKSFCMYGHPFDEANTAFYPSGRRYCRECNRRTSRDFMQARRQRTAV